MPSEKIQVASLAFVHYQHPDLEKTTSFYNDFGLSLASKTSSRLYFKGLSSQPYIYVAEQSPDNERHFLGGYYNVASAAELVKAATHPSASSISDLDGPSGGKVVRLKDPHGFIVGFVHIPAPEQQSGGKVEGLQLELPSSNPTMNTAIEKPRVGDTRRFKHGPSPVHKLGHYGIMVPKDRYAETMSWYLETLNLKPTDAMYDVKTGKESTSFNHIDIGEEFSDHHTFFVGCGPNGSKPHIHHCSFEVNDFDTQTLGHDWLRKKGWTNCWGIGRHILGSQIFDYWFDNSGNIVEHYSDGDMVNSSTPFQNMAGGPDTIYVWGPNFPLAFVTGKIEDAGKVLLAPPSAAEAKPAQYAPESDTKELPIATSAIPVDLLKLS